MTPKRNGTTSRRHYDYRRLRPHTLSAGLLRDDGDDDDELQDTRNNYPIVIGIVVLLMTLLFGAIYYFPIREVETAQRFQHLSSTGNIIIGQQPSPSSSSSLPSPFISPSSSSSSRSSSFCVQVAVTGSNNVDLSQVMGSPFTWFVNSVSCFSIGNCVQITWISDSNDYYIGQITAISPNTPSITVQFISVSPTNTGISTPWSPWSFTLVSCPTTSSSSTGSAAGSMGSMTTPQFSRLLDPISYNLSLSINQSPQWASFVISEDASTSIGCNSNCSFSYCNIYIGNQFVYSITSALNPGLSYNLGSYGLLSISSNGSTIAIGSYGCLTNSMNGIYIFERSSRYGMTIWSPVVAANSGGSYMIDNFISLYQAAVYPLIFLLSPSGNKLVYLNCKAGNCKPTQIFTIVRLANGTWDPSTITISQFPSNYQGSNNFPPLPLSAALTNHSQTLFVTTGDTAQNCASQLTYSEYGVLWFNWDQSTLSWNVYLPFGVTGCGHFTYEIDTDIQLEENSY